MVDLQDLGLRPNQLSFVGRFAEACQADPRVVAAFLGGSYAKGYADASSDVDLCVITTEAASEDFSEGREAFLRQFGDLVFLEDFDIPNIAFYIFADDTEGELNIGSESRLDQIHSGPFRTLVDKKNLLAGVIFPEDEPVLSKQLEKLRRFMDVFWHELSHFITAIQRNQIWWAQGQLEALRGICVNLMRLHHNFLDGEAGEEPYFKIEKAMPVDPLAPLKETFCPLEKCSMLQAGLTIVEVYRNIAPAFAEQHGLRYPDDLERVMMDRLEKLKEIE